jgi:hypothetical protein
MRNGSTGLWFEVVYRIRRGDLIDNRESATPSLLAFLDEPHRVSFGPRSQLSTA